VDCRQDRGRWCRTPQDPPARCCENSKIPPSSSARVDRYIDALHVAAEQIIGQSAAQALETTANRLVPGLTDEPAWPTLRAHLLLLAADGADP
jgi:hypothetical protein